MACFTPRPALPFAAKSVSDLAIPLTNSSAKTDSYADNTKSPNRGRSERTLMQTSSGCSVTANRPHSSGSGGPTVGFPLAVRFALAKWRIGARRAYLRPLQTLPCKYPHTVFGQWPTEPLWTCSIVLWHQKPMLRSQGSNVACRGHHVFPFVRHKVPPANRHSTTGSSRAPSYPDECSARHPLSATARQGHGRTRQSIVRRIRRFGQIAPSDYPTIRQTARRMR